MSFRADFHRGSLARTDGTSPAFPTNSPVPIITAVQAIIDARTSTTHDDEVRSAGPEIFRPNRTDRTPPAITLARRVHIETFTGTAARISTLHGTFNR
jgi:hypothetical protein